MAVIQKKINHTGSQRSLGAGKVYESTYETIQPFSQMTTGAHSLIRDPSAQQMTLTSNQGDGDYAMVQAS